VEPNTVRVRLTDISSNTPSMELLCYVLTEDFNEFMAVREDLLLRILDVLETSGTGVALPAQTLYLGRDSGLEKEKADNAVKKVAELREGKKLPFPDFPQEDISSFKGSIDYPQPESALRSPKPNSSSDR
jgi:MscS family membrane protein